MVKFWTTPAVVIWPMDPVLAIPSVKYSFPSVPTMIPCWMPPTGLPGVWIGNSVTTPLVVILAICWSLIVGDPEVAVGAAHDPLGLPAISAYVVTCPEVVIRPIRP